MFNIKGYVIISIKLVLEILNAKVFVVRTFLMTIEGYGVGGLEGKSREGGRDAPVCVRRCLCVCRSSMHYDDRPFNAL